MVTIATMVTTITDVPWWRRKKARLRPGFLFPDEDHAPARSACLQNATALSQDLNDMNGMLKGMILPDSLFITLPVALPRIVASERLQ
jgi:hypothetical protein